MTKLRTSDSFDKEEIRNKMKSTPQNYDMQFDYLTSLIFNDNKCRNELDGRLWLREIFIAAQVNMLQEPYLLIYICCFLLSGSYLIGVLVCDAVQDDRDTDRPMIFWIYNGLLILLNGLLNV